MLVLFPPIFVVDTKILFGYNFVAFLNKYNKAQKLKKLDLVEKEVNYFLNKYNVYKHI